MLDSQPGSRPLHEHTDDGRGKMSGQIELPDEPNSNRQPDSVIDFNTDTQHVQHPIPEQFNPQPETAKKRRFKVFGAAGLAVTGLATIGAALFSQGGNAEAPKPGTTHDTSTETSASPIPGSESTTPNADIVTPEAYADPNTKVYMPERPEAQKVEYEYELGKEGHRQREIAIFLGDRMSSLLTHGDFFKDDFKEVFVGGEWTQPPKESVPGGSTLDEDRKATLENTDDGGLAFRTHFALIGDEVKACKAINNGRSCGFNVSISVDVPTPYPMYLKMKDETGATQEVRVRQTINEAQNAEIQVIGFDKETMKPLTDTKLYLPLADIYYTGPDGKTQTRFVTPPFTIS